MYFFIIFHALLLTWISSFYDQFQKESIDEFVPAF
jgi:hypothetical protein